MRAVLMTGDELRHRYAAQTLAAAFGLAGAVSERKVPLSTFLPAEGDPERSLVDSHFASRSDVERRLLGTPEAFPRGVPLLAIEHGRANDPDVYEWVASLEPDVVLLFGTSIIRPPLLTHFGERIVNLHLGLSPYYRGSGTNFWPLVDGLPECVGATIHVATERVDGGGILGQARPEGVRVEDRAHEFGTRALMAGLECMAEVVPLFLNGGLAPVPQARGSGKLCRRKDFNPQAVRRVNENFDRGMTADYLARKAERDAAYPLIRDGARHRPRTSDSAGGDHTATKA